MSEDIILPTLLSQVRTAVANQAYEEAEKLYTKIMRYPEMQDNIDVKMRHAVCAEKIGKIDVALKCYQEVVVIYHQQGEIEAAERLEKSIAALYASAEKEMSTNIGGIEELEKKCNITPISDDVLMRQLIAMGKKETFYPTEVLCRAGDIADKIWLVEEGIVDVFMPDYAEKNSLVPKPGSFILLGELGLFTRQRRNATLIAYTTIQCIVVDIDQIYERQQRDIAFNTAMERLLRERWVEPVLKQHSVFDSVTDLERKLLAQSFVSMTLNAGETLVSVNEEHDGAYLLQSGCMFLIHEEDKVTPEKHEPETPDFSGYSDYGDLDEFITTEMPEEDAEDAMMMTGIHPGDFIQLSGLLSGFKTKYRIDAVTNVQLLYLSRERFEIFSKARPWLNEAIRRYSMRPAHLQVMHPLDDYLWLANRDISFKKDS